MNHLRTALCLAVRYDPVEGTYTLDQDHAALPFVPHPDLIPYILNGTFHPSRGPAHEAVHLRFSARSVRAYEAASGVDLSDAIDAEGRLDVYYNAPHPDELVRWILSCGAEAEVLAPDDLRCRTVMEIRRMLTIYDPDADDTA